MIELTRFNGTPFYLNVTHIETVEATPDTVITLINGKKYIVKDEAADVAKRITAFYQKASVPTIIPRPVDDLNE
jgi:flagellar protein FlbD